MKIDTTVMAMALVGVSLAFAPLLVAAPDTAGPPGAAKAPGDGKDHGRARPPGKDPAESPGQGRDKPGRGDGPPRQHQDGPPHGGRGPEGRGPGDGPPGQGDKPPGHPGLHGDDRPGVDGQRLAELLRKQKDGTLTEAEKAELERMRDHAHFARGKEARKARRDALEAKRTAGTLTDEETAELERLQKASERLEALKKKHEKRKADRDKRRHDAKRDALLRFPGFEKHAPARDEFKKHARRVAKLERSKEVAEAEGRSDLAERIDKLIAKENARHEKWLEKHGTQEKKGATP
jgi:hypothetical protein